MSLQDRWDGLSAGLRRALVLGGAVAVLLALAALVVSTPNDENNGRGDERRRLITNLLTDADPRAIGIEGLAERLRRLENHTDQLNASLEKLGMGKGLDPERDAIIEGLRRENARQLQELRLQQEALREELAAASRTPALPTPETAAPPPVEPPAPIRHASRGP
jgi:conjugal transfer pilus assembly protein TraB